jgi:hypothetical protein
VSAIIIENIYYAINKANETPLISGKIGYIITAQSLLVALVHREGETLNYPIRVPQASEEGVTIITLNNKDELVKFIEKGIKRLKELLLEYGNIIGSYDLHITKDEVSAETSTDAIRLLSAVEEEKALLIKVLILAGYDQLSFAKLESTEQEKKPFRRL